MRNMPEKLLIVLASFNSVKRGFIFLSLWGYTALIESHLNKVPITFIE